MIQDTVHQERLVAWKKKQGIQQPKDQLGTIGSKYWYSFLRRNKAMIETKKGRKFELDQTNWLIVCSRLNHYQRTARVC
jgi:hypothetical protein